MKALYRHRLKPAYVKAALLRETWLAKPDSEPRLTYLARMVEELMGRVKALEGERAAERG